MLARTCRSQEEHLRAGGADGASHGRSLVATEIVEDHNFAGVSEVRSAARHGLETHRPLIWPLITQERLIRRGAASPGNREECLDIGLITLRSASQREVSISRSPRRARLWVRVTLVSSMKTMREG